MVDFPTFDIPIESKTVATWGVGEDSTSNCLLLNWPSLNSTNSVLTYVTALFIHFKEKKKSYMFNELI